MYLPLGCEVRTTVGVFGPLARRHAWGSGCGRFPWSTLMPARTKKKATKPSKKRASAHSGSTRKKPPRKSASKAKRSPKKTKSAKARKAASKAKPAARSPKARKAKKKAAKSSARKTRKASTRSGATAKTRATSRKSTARATPKKSKAKKPTATKSKAKKPTAKKGAKRSAAQLKREREKAQLAKQREREKAQREKEREKAQREKEREKARKEREKAQREKEREKERTRKEREKAQLAKQREREKAQREKEREKARKEREKAQLAKQREREKAQREKEREKQQKQREREKARKEREKQRERARLEKEREKARKEREKEREKERARKQAEREAARKAREEERARLKAEREAAREEARRLKEEERLRILAEREAAREEARRLKEEERLRKEAEREAYRKAKEAERERVRAEREAAKRALEGRVARATRRAQRVAGVGRGTTTRVYRPDAIPNQSGTTRRIVEDQSAASRFANLRPPESTQLPTPPPLEPASEIPPHRAPVPQPPIEPKPERIEDRYALIVERLEKTEDSFRRQYAESFDMSWIYHDSALEGVVYTFQELKTAIDPNITVVPDSSLQPVCEEIRRHKAAIDLVQELGEKKRVPINIDIIKRIYLTLHPEEGDLKSVKYRKDIPQHRLYFHEYAPPDKIAYRVRQVIDWLNGPEPKKIKNPVRIAARVHYDLLRVFPFASDSGKVARLLMNVMLIRAGYPPAIIHSTERQRYYEALKGSLPTIISMINDAILNGLQSIEKLLDEEESKG